MMKKWFLRAALCLGVATPAAALDLDRLIEDHVLSGFGALAKNAEALAQAAPQSCGADEAALREAFGTAFDAWVRVSHLRFGPTEQGDRAFALAFWPDGRGKTPKALSGLIAAQDPVVDTPEAFAEASIAARGFYALEFLLYDPAYTQAGAYRCRLITAIARDIDRITGEILVDWVNQQSPDMAEPFAGRYRSETEVARQFFTALSTGMEFTSDVRLGRPLGSYDRPRPKRAEAWRSGRSLRHVTVSLDSMRQLAALLSENDAALDAAYEKTLKRAEALDDPIFAGVAEPASRLRVEALRQTLEDIREILGRDIGPKLGVTAGFNSLDGD